MRWRPNELRPPLASTCESNNVSAIDGAHRRINFVSAAPSNWQSVPLSDETLAAIRFNADGLVPAIAQDISSGEVLMMAWMSPESLARTLAEGRMVYWSRSRQELWRKGDTSGDHQEVCEALYDCDGDTLLFKVVQHGAGACHTGNRTCFFTSLIEP